MEVTPWGPAENAEWAGGVSYESNTCFLKECAILLIFTSVKSRCFRFRCTSNSPFSPRMKYSPTTLHLLLVPPADENNCEIRSTPNRIQFHVNSSQHVMNSKNGNTISVNSAQYVMNQKASDVHPVVNQKRTRSPWCEHFKIVCKKSQFCEIYKFLYLR